MKAAAVPHTIEPRDVLIVDSSTVSHDLLVVGPSALNLCLSWHAGDRAPLVYAFVDEMRSLARHGAAVFLLFEGLDTSGGAAPQEPTRERLRRDAAQREAIGVVESYGGDHVALRRDAEATTVGADPLNKGVEREEGERTFVGEGWSSLFCGGQLKFASGSVSQKANLSRK